MELFERADELDRLAACLAAARAGAGAIAVVEGPAGIGKTRLLAAARAAALDAGMVALRAVGAEVESAHPYGVVRQLLGPPLAGAPELLTGAATLAAPVLAAGDEAATTGPPAADPSFAILHGLHWLVAGLSQRAPLLLAVDDAHWADDASVRFLGYLARRLADLPAALVIATRPGELLGQLPAEAAVLRPRPLGADGAARLLAGLFGRAPEPAFANACRVATGGTPFLLRELGRAAAEAGIEPVAAAVPRVESLGPRSVAQSILARLARQSPDAVALARATAVLGDGAQLRHAAALAGLDPAAAAAAADALAAAGILTDRRPLAFVHPIVRTAIAAALHSGERASLHRAAARLFAAERGAGDRVAGHLLATEPAGDPEVVEALLAAARTAIVQGAPRSAVAFLRRALAEPPSGPARAAVLLALGFSESYAGEPSAIGHLEAALDEAADPQTQVAVTLALGRMLNLAGSPDRAAAVYERTAQRMAGRDAWTELILEGALVSAAQLERGLAATAAEHAAPLRRHVDAGGDAPPTPLAALALAAAGEGEPAATVAGLARRALAGAPPLLPEASDRPPFFYHACSALMFAERFDEARERYDAVLADAQRLGSLPHFVAVSAFRAWLHQRAGDPGAAEADARAALGVGAAPPFFAFVALTALVEVLIDRGELEAATAVLAEHGAAGELPGMLTAAPLLAARGRLRAAAGVADVRAAGELLLALRMPGPALAAWRSQLALLLEGFEAQRLAEEEVALARRFGAPRTLGIALRARALVAGDVDGLAEAVRVLEASAARLELARVRVDLGAALRRAGRRAEAREPLRAGADAAQRLGATALAERAHEELLATGARPRRLVLTGVDALTASERRVADMAADGLTNREIAQALFVTARTVEGHLTHVFQKLGIAARGELRGALQERR